MVQELQGCNIPFRGDSHLTLCAYFTITLYASVNLCKLVFELKNGILSFSVRLTRRRAGFDPGPVDMKIVV